MFPEREPGWLWRLFNRTGIQKSLSCDLSMYLLTSAQYWTTICWQRNIPEKVLENPVLLDKILDELDIFLWFIVVCKKNCFRYFRIWEFWQEWNSSDSCQRNLCGKWRKESPSGCGWFSVPTLGTPQPVHKHHLYRAYRSRLHPSYHFSNFINKLKEEFI